jgi:hypothetical protein
MQYGEEEEDYKLDCENLTHPSLPRSLFGLSGPTLDVILDTALLLGTA